MPAVERPQHQDQPMSLLLSQRRYDGRTSLRQPLPEAKNGFQAHRDVAVERDECCDLAGRAGVRQDPNSSIVVPVPPEDVTSVGTVHGKTGRRQVIAVKEARGSGR